MAGLTFESFVVDARPTERLGRAHCHIWTGAGDSSHLFAEICSADKSHGKLIKARATAWSRLCGRLFIWFCFFIACGRNYLSQRGDAFECQAFRQGARTPTRRCFIRKPTLSHAAAR